MLSRRRARMALMQILYADIFCQNTNIIDFRDTYKDENNLGTFDNEYVIQMRSLIKEYSSELFAIVQELAPKFDMETLPKVHILILFIALAEMRYFDSKTAITESISINEAIELAKQFSDISGANFISGVLRSYTRLPSDFTLKNTENQENNHSFFQ